LHFGEYFGHSEEIKDGFLDVFGSFHEEVVDCLRGRDGSLDRFEILTNIIACKVFNNINNMSHSRFHEPELI